MTMAFSEAQLRWAFWLKEIRKKCWHEDVIQSLLYLVCRLVKYSKIFICIFVCTQFTFFIIEKYCLHYLIYLCSFTSEPTVQRIQSTSDDRIHNNNFQEHAKCQSNCSDWQMTDDKECTNRVSIHILFTLGYPLDCFVYICLNQVIDIHHISAVTVKIIPNCWELCPNQWDLFTLWHQY